METIDTNFSEMCTDMSIDSGNYDAFGEDESMWINNGVIETVADNEQNVLEYEKRAGVISYE